MYMPAYDRNFLSLIENIERDFPFLLEIESIDKESLNTSLFRKRFLESNNVADTSADANANVELKTISTLSSEKVKSFNKLDSLNLLFTKMKELYGTKSALEYMEMVMSKQLNVQDVVDIDKPYCWAFDMFDLLHTGLPFVKNYPSLPAKHSDTFLQHSIQLVQFAASQMVGATAIPNVLIVYAHLLKQDSLDPDYPIPHWKEQPELFRRYVEQRFQEFVFALNQPLRQNQSCFTNITLFDMPFLTRLCEMYGTDAHFAMFIQDLFLSTFEKLCDKQMTTFPVLTAQIKTSGGNIDDEEFFKKIVRYNLPFAHINIFSAEELTALSSCCRLINDVSDIIKAKSTEHQNLIGGSSLKVGSTGVVTVNLARLALDTLNMYGCCMSSDELLEIYLKELDRRAEIAYKINHVRRVIIEDGIKNRLMPLYDCGLISLKNQYSTLGFNGLYEAIEIMGVDPLSEHGEEVMNTILAKMEEVSNRAICTYGYRCNVEQIPAESTAIKFAQVDRYFYPNSNYKIYSNQFIPLTTDTTVIERIVRQVSCEHHCTGGSILHINVEQRLTEEAMERLLRYAIKKGVRYFAVNYFIALCVNRHYSATRADACPVCGAEIAERFTRVVGFLRPVSSWHKIRREEFYDRTAVTDIIIEGEETAAQSGILGTYDNQHLEVH